MPGGFVDPGETGEAAVIREIQEEVGLESGTPEYLVSYPNIYDYKGVRNDVLDLFYRCKVESFDELTLDPAEVSNFSFLKPDEAVLNRMAFESNKLAIQFRLKMS